MKETAFEFDLKIDPNESGEVLEGLRNVLAEIKNIASVKGELVGCETLLSVRACFEDSEAAVRLHRKIMKKIIAHKGVTILQVKTRLTDIF